MNAQTKTLKVRKANKLAAPIGRHFTIQKVIRTDEKAFGFAIDDTGGEAFIPRAIVLNQNLTTEYEGAGFTAPTRESPHAEALPQIMTPVTWDGDEEIVEVEVKEDGRDYDGEIDKLIEVAEGAALLSGAVNELIERATFIHNELTAIQEWIDATYPTQETNDAI